MGIKITTETVEKLLQAMECQIQSDIRLNGAISLQMILNLILIHGGKDE